MPTPEEIRQDLPPDLPQAEREALFALGLRLQDQRPIPSPTFRGDLRRTLLVDSKNGWPAISSRRAIRALVASYITAGVLLLSIAAIGVAGGGPFAPT